MRLIDAHKLFHEYLTNELWNIPDIVYNTLLKQPTVDAIPIEWLKEKAKEYAWKYWDAKDNHHKLMLPMKDVTIVIEQMVEEWKKENE